MACKVLETNVNARRSVDPDDDDRLSAAVERLTSIQKSILELSQEANQIRRHIKDFDINLDALNILVTVRSKDQTGDGAGVLAEVNSYARQTGMQVEALEDTEPSIDSSSSRSEFVQQFHQKAENTTTSRAWKTVSQFVLAVAVTLGLFLLIH